MADQDNEGGSAGAGDREESKASGPDRQGGGGDGLGGPDAGSPGGMGGAGVSGATGGKGPPGGLSPVQGEQDEDSGK